MSDKKLKLATGNWVVGSHFWNRDQELALFIERLKEGAHLLLVAPRRIGKTSLMREAARRMESHHICLHVDLQKSLSAADAIVELSLAARPYASLWEKTASVFSNALTKLESVEVHEVAVKLRNGVTAGDWQVKGERVMEILAASEKPVVLFFDEVPILVNRLLKGSGDAITPAGRQAADGFLSWLRHASIRHQGRISIVLTGSIGLAPIVHQAGLSATLNTFAVFPLGPWNRETAVGCLRALSQGHDLDLEQEAIDSMLDKLGIYVPHHVQMFFDHVYRAARLAGVTKASREFVLDVYEHSMTGVHGHVELSHMQERLRMVLPPEWLLLAMDLITEAAVFNVVTDAAAVQLAKEHIPKDSMAVLRDILGILEHDGYLCRIDGGHAFESGLLKDWWSRHLGYGYVRASKRTK
jgi:hypothetical protein